MRNISQLHQDLQRQLIISGREREDEKVFRDFGSNYNNDFKCISKFIYWDRGKFNFNTFEFIGFEKRIYFGRGSRERIF